MGLRFYIGGSGAGKSHILYEDVIRWSQEEPGTNFLIIVPDQFTMQTQKDIVLKHPNKGIMNIDVLSFGRLSYRVFEEVGGNDKPVLDDTGKSLVLRKIAGELEGKLQVIGSNLKKIGYIHEVKSSISEFMQYGIGAGELAKLIDFSGQRGALQYKLQDLKVLYEGFLDYIKGGFITTEESLTILKNRLVKSNMITKSVIVFDGFTGFTPVQNSLIQELMILAKDVIVTAVIDGKENPYQLDGEQKLFHLSKKTIATLSKLAQEANITRGKDIILQGAPVTRYADNESLSHLEQCLFRFGKEPYEKEQKSVCICEAENPGEEVRIVCRKIHTMIRERGYRYQDIAVVTGDLSGYAHFIENEFGKYAIPCFLDQTRGIVLNPFIEYIRSGLAVVRQKFSYEAVFHFLRSGLVDLAEGQVDRMENYVLAMGIRGIKRWTTLWTRRSKAMGADFEEELELLNHDRECVFNQLQPLLELGKKRCVEQIVRQVYAFITKADLQQKLVHLESHFKEEGDLSRAKEYAQIYRLVMDLLNQIVELLGNEIMDLQEFTQILDAGFGEIQVGTIPLNADQVVVGDIERTRLKKIKVLFFIGINDGIIPKNGGSGGLLSDIDREFLKEAEFELAPTPRQQMYIQRLYLYMNMTKPTEQLLLSYSKVNGEGKSIRPAYLVGTIQKMYPNLKIEKGGVHSLTEKLVTAKSGIPYLVAMLRDYAENRETSESEFFTLYHWYDNSEEYRLLLHKLVHAAFYEYTDNPLGKIVANALYGKNLENSVSRLEKYASCAYAHFLQYGLALQERGEYSFENVDMGNVFHGVLEAFAGKLAQTPYTWFDFPKEVGEALVDESLESYTIEYGDTVLFSSARNEYMITRMRRILRRTVSTLQYQLKKGVFSPSQFEVSFSVMEDLDSVNIALSGDEKMRLRGRIDRVDTYEDEENIYVKVIDYKSGNKSFDLVALYYGLQLQLVVYLNAAMEMAEKQHKGKQIVPAAVLYYHVFDPMVEKGNGQISPEELNQKLLEELKTTGVINASTAVTSKLDTSMTTKSDIIPVEYKKDGSFTAASSVMEENDLRTISSYVNKKIKEIGSGILAGKTDVNPYEMGIQSSCSYCSYAGICGYDSKITGYSMRKLGSMKKEEAFEKIKAEVEGGGE